MLRKVLVVEDNKMNRSLLRNILEKEYEVLEAVNGEEALSILHRKHKIISAVLLDIVMPVLDGYAVLNEMRGNAVLAQIPVIVATGSEDEETEVRALSLGANDFVTKPYNPTLILHCLRNTISLRETASIVNAIQRDKLTGLYNREAFFGKVTAMLREREPGYYMMTCFDIDNFKLINDQYGASEGDRILQHIGKMARTVFSHVGGICSRISADNFAALYPCGKEESDFVTHSRDHTFSPSDTRATISFSEGRYVVSDLSLTASALYDRAYIAKQSIKGRYDEHMAYFTESMREKLLREQAIISDMDTALSDNQFEVWFQPQFNHASGALIGAEALVRWRHPEKGLISPDNYVPVFEQNGFIYEMDKYVWEQVCSCLRRWIDEGRSPLPISINISRYDIFKTDFFEAITGLVEKYKLPVELLRLEITESAFTKSAALIISIVEKLIEYGFTVEIDDFGSGYSSLNTLKDVPATVLKLDMRFLENSGDLGRGGNILESIVRMAKWLDMSVIAEGVETIAQADFLKSIGCDYVQGYLYARPMPMAEYEQLARNSGKEQRLLALETVANLDNNSFWDPQSMETLIFNSYIGGACIYEYHDGNIELLRANEKYAQVLGSDCLTLAGALKLNWPSHLDARGAELLKASIERSIDTGDEVMAELEFIDLPGCPKITYLRSFMRVIASSGSRHLVYCTNENITEQRKAELELRETGDRLSFLNDMAHGLLAHPDTEAGILAMLRKLVEHFASSRAYILELSVGGAFFSNTYEVCAEGVSSEKARLQSLPLSVIDSWLRALQKDDFISIGSVDVLDDSRAEEREILRAQGISSLIAVPIHRDGALIGFIGIDDPARRAGAAERLSVLGDYLAVILTRRDLDARISLNKAFRLDFMNDIPGGFLRLSARAGLPPEIDFINDGFCRLTGMSRDEASQKYGVDLQSFIHQDDRKIADAFFERLLETGEAQSPQLRLRHGDGWLLVVASGRATRAAEGESLLNVFITDISDRTRVEVMSRQLLDNLPCGAALYDFDGENTTGVFLNRRYHELMNRKISTTRTYRLNSLHPDDHEAAINDIKAAIREGRDYESCVRLLYGDSGEYRYFNVMGRAIPQENGHYALYSIFLPIEDERLEYQKMLPIALSAVIGNSDFLAFIKDRNYRIICCSRPFAKMAGYSDPSELIGKTDYDILPLKMAERFHAGEVEIVENGVARLNYDELLPQRDGSIVYGSTSKHPLMDSNGNVIGIYSITRDITKAHEHDSQLRLMNDSIPGGLVTYRLTADSIEMSYFNDGFARLIGFTSEEHGLLDEHDPLSLVFREDIDDVKAQLQTLLDGAETMAELCRIHTLDGGYKWISYRGAVSERRNGTLTINVVMLDVTEPQETMEKLRISEEEHRLAVKHSGSVICRYNVAEKTLIASPEFASVIGVPVKGENVPYEQVREGLISPETTEAYIELFERINRGEREGIATYVLITDKGSRWLEAHFSTIFSSGKPVSAVMSFVDITDRLEKETVYRKWQQSLHDKEPSSYTMYRYSLTSELSYEITEGSLLSYDIDESLHTFNERTLSYVNQRVSDEDRDAYISLLDSEYLLKEYYCGKRSHSLDYRERLAAGGTRWIRVTLDLVERPGTADIDVYMMYEDIDELKREELLTLDRAEHDPLTGVLNRITFEARVDALLKSSGRDVKSALLMLDVDGFKLVNDVFGHAAGDQTLVDIASTMRSALRKDDLLGRLGGDEFVVFLHDIPNDAVVMNKARSICSLVKKSFSVEVQISGSIGITIAPRDGDDFDTLYRKADSALYNVKGSGKDNYALYHDNMDGQHLAAPEEQGSTLLARRETLRRMLIVDDSRIDCELLSNIFKDEFIVEKVKDGASALIRLRHYGKAVSIVLLDLIMPGMDGFAVLAKMQESPELQSIPVVVVSASGVGETSLRAIRSGASDYVPKPVDADLLRIRVRSAISRAENERLRAQNSLLELESGELSKYKFALERSGVTVIEYDWIAGHFTYDQSISGFIAGTWDKRKLWHILLTDLITDVATVQKMQQLVHSIAEDRSRSEGEMVVLLKAPNKTKHRFIMNIYKQANEYNLTDKLIITLRDVGEAGGGESGA